MLRIAKPWDAGHWMARDGLHKPVPLWLHKTFKGRQQLLYWCRRLDDLITQLNELRGKSSLEAARSGNEYENYIKHLDISSLVKQLRRVGNEVQWNMPFCRCLRQDSEPGCPICDGDGWVTSLKMLDLNIRDMGPLKSK